LTAALAAFLSVVVDHKVDFAALPAALIPENWTV